MRTISRRKSDRTADQCEGAQKRERKNFTPEQKTILNGFIEEHYKNCYPSIEEKEDLAQKTNLTLSQVNDYFINARRRYLPKYILKNKSGDEAETRRKRRTKSVSGSGSASKKLKPSPTDSSLAAGSSTSGISSGSSISSNSQDVVDDISNDCPTRDGSGSGDEVFSLDPGASCGDRLDSLDVAVAPRDFDGYDPSVQLQQLLSPCMQADQDAAVVRNEEPGSGLSSWASSPLSSFSPSSSPASSPYREETSSDEERPSPSRTQRELDAAFGLLKFADLIFFPKERV